MTPMLTLPGPPAGESFVFRRGRQRLDMRYRETGKAPTWPLWLHLGAIVVLLWVAASEALAGTGDVLVTETNGTVTVISGTASPVRAIAVLQPGVRVRIAPSSSATLFISEGAKLFEIQGPVDIDVTPKGIRAVKGKLPTPRVLHDAYRRVDTGRVELVQGSLEMRNGEALAAMKPEGIVVAEAARKFTWPAREGLRRFELATDEGDLVHGEDVSGNELTLPATVTLRPGVKYVWGVAPREASPTDWTEFSIAADNAPVAGNTRSERIVHAAWLRSQNLQRASTRELQRALASPQ